MNSFKDMFDKMSQFLKTDSKEVDQLLKNIGVSKEEAIQKLNTIDKEKLLESVNENTVNDLLSKLSDEEIKKIKNINPNDINSLKKVYDEIVESKKE